MVDLDAIEAQQRRCVHHCMGPDVADLVLRHVPALLVEVREGLQRERDLALERNKLRAEVARLQANSGAEVSDETR